MKLAFIADTHNRHDEIDIRLFNKENVDILVVCGDFLVQGYAHELEKFVEWLELVKKYTVIKEYVVIAGNHDTIFEDAPDTARAMLPDWVHYLEDEAVELLGYKFWGTPWTPRFYNWAFNVDRGPAIAEYWHKIPHDTEILVTHGPPHGILDVSVYDNIPVGCEELLKRVYQVKPLVHAFGHIHHWTGQQQEEHTLFVNAAMVTEQYKLTKQPEIVELEDRWD